jgi:chemotaxis regulatin CheY-phosphate phosphatase CheZ
MSVPGNTEQNDLRQMVDLVASVVPMLDTIRLSIEEGSGHIPRASQQLQNVTQATETATMEILNVLDSMTQKISDAENGLAAVKEVLMTRQTLERQLTERLNTLGSDGTDGKQLSSLTALWTQHQQIPGVSDRVGAVEESLAQSKADSINIAMALQVQDITSQQIAGVLDSIEVVRGRLQKALEAVGGTAQVVQQSGVVLVPGAVPKHYDTDAEYTPSGARQESADAIVRSWNKDTTK